MSKISRVIASIIASMAVALAGCAAGREVAEGAGEAALKGGGHMPKIDVPIDVPKIDIPNPPLIDPVPPPGSEKFAEQNLTALRTATHWNNKQDELKYACGVYNVPQFMKASNKTRWLEAKFKIPSAQAAELADLAEEIERLPEHPTAPNVSTTTADAICQGQEVVDWFGE